MMANDPGSAPPGSPRSPRLPRSRTNSPLMAGGRSFSPGIHADPTFMNQKDRVMGELASRIKKPVSSSAGFNKNRQGNSKSLTIHMHGKLVILYFDVLYSVFHSNYVLCNLYK